MQVLLEDEIGDILQKARAGNGLSFSELAKATRIQEDRLRELEDGVRLPDENEILQLASPLGLSAPKLARIANRSWAPNPPQPGLKNSVLIVQGRIGSYPVNGYLLFDPKTRRAACIDTAYDAGKMLAAAKTHDLQIETMLLTHCHQDHMGGAEEIKSRTGASVHIHPAEMPLFSRQSRLKPDGFLDEEEKIPIGDLSLEVLSTPGHTPGGVSFVCGPLCFVGDALFAGSTGRSMSPQGYQQLLSSLREKVLSLPDPTVILPGHGPATTVKEEKAHNPFF